MDPLKSQTGPVKVKVLEVKPQAGGKTYFKVQEPGMKPGMLQFGTPPATLPAVDAEIDVYRNEPFNESNPQYRWDKPAPPQAPPPKRGPGGPPRR